MDTLMEKQHVYELIDRLPPSQLAAVAALQLRIDHGRHVCYLSLEILFHQKTRKRSADT